MASDTDFIPSQENLSVAASESEILANIQELHRRLQQVREGADDETTFAPKTHQRRLIVVSNRLPLTLQKTPEGFVTKMSSGGLVSALSGVKKRLPFVWVGWPGAEFDLLEQEQIKKKLRDELGCVPVFLPAETADQFYNGYCNDVLWPLFHYVPIPIIGPGGERKFDSRFWRAYVAANQRFMEMIIDIYEPGDLIWVHDYHLMLLPAMLRKRIRDASIGFFLHTPFPSSEVYRILPTRKEILQGLLCSDLVGFHTYDYARHFLSSCTRILGLEATPKGVSFNGHFAHIGIFPIGIDFQVFTTGLEKQSVKQRIVELQERYKNKKIILGVDRLDYIKGVPHKLLAMESFLSRYPDWKDRVLLIQVAVPSRTEVDEYKKLATQCNELVGRINGKFGSIDFAPIVYINQSVTFDELCALYYVADACIITSLRDGMNLVAYEYVACQRERHGVLILSEFAGCAQSLSGALRINPWNTEQMAVMIYEGLTKGNLERELKHNKLYQYVTTHTASHWGDTFVSEIERSCNLTPAIAPPPPLNVHEVIQHYQTSKRRLVIFDYDGTLCRFQSLPQLARPSPALLRNLERLASDPRNTVFIVSGRDMATIDKWFGFIKNLGLAAGHGQYYRMRGSTDWKSLNPSLDLSWMDSILPILQYFTERTPGSFIETKEAGLAWHWRDADPEFGSWQTRELQLHLAEVMANIPVELIHGNKVLEVRPVGINKGAICERVLHELEGDVMNSPPRSSKFGPSPTSAEPVDFLLCIGDDRTDEDMFQYFANATLPSSLPANKKYCVVVGHKISTASYFINDIDDVTEMIQSLVAASGEEIPSDPHMLSTELESTDVAEEVK